MNETETPQDLWRILVARDASIGHLTARLDALMQALEAKESVIRDLKRVCDEREALIKALSHRLNSPQT